MSVALLISFVPGFAQMPATCPDISLIKDPSKPFTDPASGIVYTGFSYNRAPPILPLTNYYWDSTEINVNFDLLQCYYDGPTRFSISLFPFKGTPLKILGSTKWTNGSLGNQKCSLSSGGTRETCLFEVKGL